MSSSRRVSGLLIVALLISSLALPAIALAQEGSDTSTPNGPAATPTPTPTPVSSDTPTSTATLTPSETPEPSATPRPSETKNGATATPAAATETATPTLSPSPTPTPAPEGDRPEYPLEELRAGGESISSEYASLRIADPPGLLTWVTFTPAANLLAKDGSASAREYLEPNQLIRRDVVRIRSAIAVPPRGAEDMTLRVVTYRVETVNGSEVVRGLQTRKQAVAFRAGMSSIDVDLPTVDSEHHVTMWLETADGERVAAWRFRHHSAATARAAPIDSNPSWGDVLAFAGRRLILWILAGGLLGLGAAAALVKRARAPPGYGWQTSLVVVTLVYGLLGLMFPGAITEGIVRYPESVAIPAGFAFFLVGIEIIPMGAVRKVDLLRPSVTDAPTPSGEDGVDWIRGSSKKTILIASLGDGVHAVVRSGYKNFFARVYGGASRIVNYDEPKARVELTNSSEDELILLEPGSGSEGELLESYAPPGFTLALPDSWKGLALRLGVVAGAGAITYSVLAGPGAVTFGLAAAGVVAFPMFVKGTEGYAVIPWGSAHLRRAVATSLHMAREVDNAETLSEEREARLKAEARTERSAERKAAERDSFTAKYILGAEDAEDAEPDEKTNGDGRGDSEIWRRNEKTILKLLEDGEISPEDAEDLLGEKPDKGAYE